MQDSELGARIRELRVIWAQTLEVEADGIADTDNFFDIGGDSMLALEAATHSRRAGIGMPISAVLRYPVLAELAAAVLEPERFALSTDNP
jgi:aryl carrier-like protein